MMPQVRGAHLRAWEAKNVCKHGANRQDVAGAAIHL